MDATLTAFHEQNTDDAVILNGFGAIVNALGLRAKPYFVQIVGTINWRLNHKSIRIRQQAADLVSKISHCMNTKRCLIKQVKYLTVCTQRNVSSNK